MKLYNTLTKEIETIEPIAAPRVTVYTCGPTVYDYPHIGNWFTFIRYDLLIRALIANNYKPDWVLNITDVGHLVSDADEGEDKLERGAKREGKTAWEVAEYYTNNFLDGMKALNILVPNELPRATKHIVEQIDLVRTLERKGYTYTIDDGVYFDTSRFADYDKFAQLDIDEQQEGARVPLNPQKRNPTDFALWKFSPKDHKRDMEWDSPWGKGFPGWHLECSAMAMKYLGETIDIHAGGIDHVPVHHTNEIAQSQAATGKTLAHYWMHSNHVTIDGKKIAKSDGNGITLEDIEAKHFSPEVFRLLVLQSHYRTQSTFSWDTLDAAKNLLQSYQQVSDLVWQPVKYVQTQLPDDVFSGSLGLIREFLSNDLNTPMAIANLSATLACVNSDNLSEIRVEEFKDYLKSIEELLGLKLLRDEINQQQLDLINRRQAARESGNWGVENELRLELIKERVGVADPKLGSDDEPIWYHLI